jgi:hypothetical protein
MIRLQQIRKQIARLERRAAFLQEISRKYWNVRRVLFVVSVLLAMVFCTVAGTRVAWIVAGLLTAVFCVVTIFHNRVRDSLTRISVLIDIKQVQIARILLEWDRLPLSEPTSLLGDHPFANDLDIGGERSLHRLLDCAVTKEGSERLKSWLLNVRPDAELIKHRQALVQELKDQPVFRDKLQLLSALARIDTGGAARKGSHHWNSRILVDWIERVGAAEFAASDGRRFVSVIRGEHNLHRPRGGPRDSAHLAPHAAALHGRNAGYAISHRHRLGRTAAA